MENRYCHLFGALPRGYYHSLREELSPYLYNRLFMIGDRYCRQHRKTCTFLPPPSRGRGEQMRTIERGGILEGLLGYVNQQLSLDLPWFNMVTVDYYETGIDFLPPISHKKGGLKREILLLSISEDGGERPIQFHERDRNPKIGEVYLNDGDGVIFSDEFRHSVPKRTGVRGGQMTLLFRSS